MLASWRFSAVLLGWILPVVLATGFYIFFFLYFLKSVFTFSLWPVKAVLLLSLLIGETVTAELCPSLSSAYLPTSSP